jgi:hypothetical protein
MALTLRASAIWNTPPARLQAVANPDGTAHHLDAAANVGAEPAHQCGEAVFVSGDGALRQLTCLIE